MTMKDSSFSHLVRKGDRAMFVTGVVLVAIMGAVVHSMLSGLTPLESLLTPGATVVQAKDDSPKPNRSNADSSTSEAQTESQPTPNEENKPEEPARRAINETPPQPVNPPTIQKPRGLIDEVIKTVDDVVKAVLPIELCVTLLIATC